jgi:hypothetical protein
MSWFGSFSYYGASYDAWKTRSPDDFYCDAPEPPDDGHTCPGDCAICEQEPPLDTIEAPSFDPVDDIEEAIERTIEVECAACGGEGRDIRLASPSRMNVDPEVDYGPCGVCDRRGVVEVETHPLTLEDLEAL